MQTKLKIIVRLDSRVEIDSNGAMRTIYRRKEFRPGHPEYQKELDLQNKFIQEEGYLPKVAA